MKVRFSTNARGDVIASTTLRVMGGTITVQALTTRDEARAMLERAQQRVGFRLSLKSLGKAVKAIAKPKTLLKVTALASAIATNPAAAVTAGPQLVQELKRGMAAKRVVDEAAKGDPRAKRLLGEAAAAAQTGGVAPAPPGVPHGVWRYLVTLERLANAA